MQERIKKKRLESAVSEVIGSVMLISVVVTAIAIIAVVLTSQPLPQKIPALDAIISSNGKDTIRIYHNGGDSLSRQEVAILVDGVEKTSGFTIRGSGWTMWSPGESLDYNLGSLPGKVQIIFNSGSSQTVLVSTDFAGRMPTYVPTAIPTPGAAATVTGINPNVGITGSSISTTISGAGFVNGAIAKFSQGSTLLTVTNVIVVSQNQINCIVNLNGAATGQWNITVTNPGSPPGTLANGFTVIPAGPAPTVISITPNFGNSGSSVGIGNLTGTNFIRGASVKLSRLGNPDLFASNVNVLDTTNLTCTLTLPAGTSPGSWDVTVINTDGRSGVLSNSFTVNNPGLTVTGITPNSGIQDYSVTVTNLAGSGFETLATVRLNSLSYPDIPATGVVVVNQNQIICAFDLTGAPSGTRNVVVTNTDGREGMLVNGFTITANAPAITGISPNTGMQGTVVSGINLAGRGFQNNARINLTRSGYANITANAVVVVSPARITCSFDLTGAATGSWNIDVINPDYQSGSLANGFTVTSAVPAPVTADFTGTPTSGTVPLPVQFADASTGSPTEYLWNFGDSQSSTLRNPSHSYSSTSGSPFTVSLRVGNGTGIYNTQIQTGYITVSAAPTPPPIITTVNPATVRRNVNSLITIGGTGFQSSGTTEVLFRRHGTITIIAGTAVMYVSPTQITCMFRSANTAGLVYDVQVINPDYQTSIKASAITTIA
jgi:PKD repeat protein